MRLAIVYDPKSSKLIEEAYSQSYRDMWKALINRFDDVVHITEETDMSTVEADVIIVYDIHSSHYLKLKGLKEHKAVKYTYYNDPWQPKQEGVYWFRQKKKKFKKLGPAGRAKRTIERGMDYIICPSQYGYWHFIAPHLGMELAEKMLVWHPISVDEKRFDFDIPLVERKRKVLLNGHLWRGDVGWRPYEFRRWAVTQNIFTVAPHVTMKSDVPCGLGYPKFLSGYAGSCAFCDRVTVPKHTEIPAAGCVCFIQMNHDCRCMGFEDMVNCVNINRGNAREKARDFTNNVEKYQKIADAGKNLVMTKWTAGRFADFIYNHAKERIDVAA
jgi:hypothetical protein